MKKQMIEGLNLLLTKKADRRGDRPVRELPLKFIMGIQTFISKGPKEDLHFFKKFSTSKWG